MVTFLLYIVKSTCCLTLFYLGYKALLSNETFFRFNRMVLLAGMLVCMLLPFVELRTESPGVLQMPLLQLEEMIQEGVGETVSQHSVVQVVPAVREASGSWGEWAVYLYLVGMAVVLCRLVRSFVSLLWLIRSGEKIRKERYTLVLVGRPVAPFNWGAYIVLSLKDYCDYPNEILTHEQVHWRKHHSLDLIYTEAVVLLHWFNPAAWLLKRELQEVHEYQADTGVLKNGIDATKYQLLLVKKAVGSSLYTLANSFNHSSLKKRITMMLKEKSSPWARLKYLYVLPLAAIAITAFARPEVSTELDEISAVKVNDLTAIVKAEEVKSAEILSEDGIKVKGRVLDEEYSSGIIGANVLIKGSTIGTVTDEEGRFELPVEAGNVLQISFAGYKTVEVKVSADEKEQDIVIVMSGEKPSAGGQVFQIAEEMPSFPGGIDECMRYIARHVKYPAISIENGAQGIVSVRFIIEKDGSISNPKIAQGVDEYLDKEAMRVIMSMPKWKPGKQRGVAVRTQFTLPVKFRLVVDEAKKDNTPLQNRKK